MLNASGKTISGADTLEEISSLQSEVDKLKIDHQSLNLFMQAPVGICILTGPQFVIQLANEKMLSLWGKHENILYMPILQALPEMVEQQYFQILQNVVKTGETFKADESEVILFRNGIKEVTYFNFINQPYRSTDGSISGVLVIAMEVTETVVSRKKIEESETKLRNIIEQTPTPILILKGEDFVLEVANQHLFDLWNVTSDAIGKPFLEILPEMRDQVFVGLLQEVFTTGKTYHGYETPAVFHRKSGNKETVFVNFIYQPYRVDDGTISGVIVLASDITEQVMAKQELIRSEERNRLAVESTRLGTYEVDLTTNTIVHNARIAEIFGLAVSEQIPYSVFINAVHPDDKIIRTTAHKIAKETGEIFYEVRIIKPDKTIRWIRLNGRVVAKNDTASLLIGTVLDISEEKKAAEILEQKIAERTKELVQSNAELEKTNTELEQFAHISSHDLQEPLRKIRLFTNLIITQSNQVLEEGVSKNLYKIKETAERMSSTLIALLNYTELKKAGEFVSINLNEIMHGVLTDVELIVSEKKAEILFDTLPAIEGVSHQIQQLFYNLISNALKFSKSGVAPVITIRSRTVSSADYNLFPTINEVCVEIVIEDNGVGFDQNLSEKIFSMFQRLHKKEIYPGTGIGLALCKKVVENHNGAIWATSVLNEGSRFHILLPLKQIETV